MFSFRRNEILPVEAYGKLPIAKDYLRVGCSEGASAQWRDWLDRAYSGSAGGVFPKLAWPARFLVGEAWGEPLVGVLWPSSDAGGLRKFPISFHVERRRKLVAHDLEQGWRATAGVWQALDALRERTAGESDGQRFLASVRACELEVERIGAVDEDGLDFGEWKRAIDAEGEGLDGLLRRLAELRRAGPRAMLRVPLVAHGSLVAQARAWWSLCCEIGVLDRAQVPTVVLPARVPEPDEAFALFSARVLTAQDVIWLAPPTMAGTAGIEDLADPLARRAQGACEAPQPLENSLRGAWTSFAARRG